MKAEEALERHKKTGQELTVAEILEMGKEQFSKYLLMMLEEAPKEREEFIMMMAGYYFVLYEWGEAAKKSGEALNKSGKALNLPDTIFPERR